MVQVGDVVKLRKSIFENEFLNSDWDSKYLYEDVFKHVSLRFGRLNQPGDMARTFFGSSKTVVEDIECDYKGQPFIILTSAFIIVYPSALENKEISIVSCAKECVKQLEAEKKLIDDLEFLEISYLEGLFNVMERENNKLDMYRLGFFKMRDEGKWKNK